MLKSVLLKTTLHVSPNNKNSNYGVQAKTLVAVVHFCKQYKRYVTKERFNKFTKTSNTTITWNAAVAGLRVVFEYQAHEALRKIRFTRSQLKSTEKSEPSKLPT